MSPDGHARLGGSGLLPASADMQRAPSGRLPISSALSASRAASGRLPLSAAAGASRAATSSGRLPTLPNSAALKAARRSAIVAEGGGRKGSGDAPGMSDEGDSPTAPVPLARPLQLSTHASGADMAAPVRTAGFSIQDSGRGGFGRTSGGGSISATRGGAASLRGRSYPSTATRQQALRGPTQGGPGTAGRGRGSVAPTGAIAMSCLRGVVTRTLLRSRCLASVKRAATQRHAGRSCVRFQTSCCICGLYDRSPTLGTNLPCSRATQHAMYCAATLAGAFCYVNEQDDDRWLSSKVPLIVMVHPTILVTTKEAPATVV